MNRRIAVLTTFFEAKSGYSLISVAEQHIRSLHRHGYEPIVIVHEHFEETGYWTSYNMDLRPILPAVPVKAEVDEHFEDYVEQIVNALQPVLPEIDVIMSHDIFYQDYYMAHNQACRRLAAAHPKVLWLNWVHSAPHDPPPHADDYPYRGRFTPPPGYVVTANHSQVRDLARMFRTEERQIRVVRHAVDPCEVAGANDLTRTLYEAARFGESDVCIVYPARLHPGKQPDKVLRIASAIQHAGVSTTLLIIDWQSQQARAYADHLKSLAAELGFSDRFFLTSDIDGRCKNGTPRETVLQLMRLADLFILPSTSETYSLVVHEAMLAANLVVLNEDLQPMHELYNGFARYLPFGSRGSSREYFIRAPDGTKVSDPQAFWNDRAMEILAEIRGSRVLFARSVARTQWNPDRIFESQLNPVLYLEAPQ